MTSTRVEDQSNLKGEESLASSQTAWLSVALLAALSTTLMLESIRVFVSYLVFVVDQSNRPVLAVVVLGVFLAIGLSGLIHRVVPPGIAVPALVLTLAIARLLLQFIDLPTARIWSGAAVIIVWGWLLAGLLRVRPGASAYGLGFGLVLDLVIRVSFASVDLPWMPGIAQHGVTAMLVLALGSALLRFEPAAQMGLDRRQAASVFVIGPALATFHLITGNLGLAQVKTGLDFPRAATLLSLGLALGMVAAALLDARGPQRLATGAGRLALAALLAATTAAGLWLFWSSGDATPAALGLLAASGASVALLVRSLGTDSTPEPEATPVRLALWFTAGLIVQVALLFAYYTFSGNPTLLIATVALFLGAGVAGSIGVARRRVRGFGVPLGAAAALGWLALLVSLAQLLTWSSPAAGPPLGTEVTIMTYNIQNGFSLDNEFSLDRIAQIIEIERPDVVVVQEVSRGWLVASGIDEVLWLSRRLGMPYAFGANSDDGLWGNLILSRSPLLAAERYQYPTTDNLKRGVVAASLEGEPGNVWVLGTHLDNPSGAGAVRLEQVQELLRFWAGRRPTLLAGDFNAAPDDPVLEAVRAAGFDDPGRTLPAAAATSEDRGRIDYILATNELTLVDIQILETDASDHRPVLARFTLRQPRG